MGAMPVFNFICDICGDTTSTEIDSATAHAPRWSAPTPEGWYIATPWIRVGMGFDYDEGFAYEDSDGEPFTSWCTDCTDDVEDFINSEKKSYDKAREREKRSTPAPPGTSQIKAQLVDYDPSGPYTRNSQQSDTPAKAPESHAERPEGQGVGKEDQKASETLTDLRQTIEEQGVQEGPHMIILGEHHYVRAANCVYKATVQTGYQCDTCSTR